VTQHNAAWRSHIFLSEVSLLWLSIHVLILRRLECQGNTSLKLIAENINLLFLLFHVALTVHTRKRSASLKLKSLIQSAIDKGIMKNVKKEKGKGDAEY